MNYTDLSLQERIEIIHQVQAKKNLNLQIIEKDWWVTAVLRALFSLPYAGHISFKGGTNLSKCWNLINRMSEDADIAIDREFLGFGGVLSKTQISDKLRRASCLFVREKLQYDLQAQLMADGINEDEFAVNVDITPITTTDPEIIEIAYRSVFQGRTYIRPKVIIEVSGRSMSEPVSAVMLRSFIDEVFTDAPFAGRPFEVRAVIPERTFLEKLFLLHEEFSKPVEQIRTERMSRHINDISQIMDTPIAKRALRDVSLYNSVIEHRRQFIGLKGFDYSTLRPQSLRIVPPADVMELWRKDYGLMQESMIYGESLPFDKLIEKIRALNDRINSLQY